MRRSTPGDAVALSAHMREADRLEVQAASGRHPLGVLNEGLAISAECWTVVDDFHRVVCMWGVVPVENAILGERVGAGWLLTSEYIELCPKAFMLACHTMLPSVLRDWDVLTNWIDCRHEKAMRWATRLGFRIEPPTPFGVEDRPFCRFEVRREDLNV